MMVSITSSPQSIASTLKPLGTPQCSLQGRGANLKKAPSHLEIIRSPRPRFTAVAQGCFAHTVPGGRQGPNSYLPFTPFRNSLRDTSKAVARAAKWRSPTSRTPRSRSEMWTSWMPDCSARSICRQPLFFRSCRILSPTWTHTSGFIPPALI